MGDYTPPPASVDTAKDEVISSRIYDATVIGEPLALGKDKRKVWEKMMNARIVYLGEAEQVPIGDDKDLELEIVKNLRKRCMEAERPISLALEAFPCDLQAQLNLFTDKRIDGEALKSFVKHWPPQRWQEYEPLLTYCRDNGVGLVVPLENYIDRNHRAHDILLTYWSYEQFKLKAFVDFLKLIIILQAVADCVVYAVVVVNHVTYGSRGTGLPARISRKMQKKNQVDLQKGLDLGLVSPEVLQNFFDLEQYPVISELTHRFQGFRERLLADPKFLHRLAIEETISITTTLIAHIEAVKGLLGSIPDNAFQKNLVGKEWNLNHRIASVLVGGFKLAGVGFISSIGAVASSNVLYAIRKILNPSLSMEQQNKRSPILKTAFVYSTFLGTSANLRYQVIAGIVEHRISEQFSDQTLLVNMLSFVARTVNSYWGTQQWIDLARYTGLQARKSEEISFQTPDPSNSAALECNILEDASIDESNKQ
ncbi:UNVERIFIED_CONTAM: protein RETICULATA-RELATED 5, chloroplastic [Sesamum calycinum]|uniref:Protein RETICULATA-RELATED 5, chloroplastic n=1 Tax=Sesamum calycinum TaxID=2727403 RepID=A0AAW2RQG0_9LAMI